jgi:predicted aspartyl protease
MRAAVIVTVVLVGLCAPAQAAVTRFELGEQGGIVLPVMLNGRGPFKLLLDTGSTHSAVSDAVAAAIGAPAVAKTIVGSAAGGREALVVRVDSLECGALVARGLLASVATFAQLSASDEVQGVIGLDALAAIRYTIDFRRRELLWWPDGKSMARGVSVALEGSHGRFLISLPQRHDVLRLVPDSGAGSLLLFDPSKRLPLTLLGQRGTLTTMSGQGAVRTALIRELQVGTATLQDVTAVVVGRNPTEPDDADGLLPLHLFDKVTFDGPNRLLILEMPI